MHKSKVAKKSTRKTWKTVGLALLILFGLGLVGARIYLPYWLTGYVNTRINELKGYGGSVDDIDIHLWRGAYQIHGLNIYKTKGKLKDPFIAANTIDLSIEWRALFKGSIVAEVDINGIDLNFAKSQTGTGAGWVNLVNALTPFKINHVNLNSGKVAYLDKAANPPVNLYISGINAQVTNLRNVDDKNLPLPSDINVSGTSIGNGKLGLIGHINIMKDTPDFDLDLKLENADLTAFNDYTRNAAAIDFTGGNLSVYAELAAANGKVTGYVKPIARQVSLVDMKQDSILNAIWEGLVAFFMHVFKNHPKDQFALNIPINGTLNNPDQDTWAAFRSIFRNAFGEAFKRNTDGKISFKDALKVPATTDKK